MKTFSPRVNVQVLAAPLVLSCVLTAQKVPDVRVDRAPNGAKATSVQLAAVDGALYAIWTDDRHGLADVFFSRSVDGGATWSPDERLDRTSQPGEHASAWPGLYANGDHVCALWQDRRDVFSGEFSVYTDPNPRVSRSVDGGRSWLPADVRLGAGLPWSGFFDIQPEIAGDGDIVATVWHSQEDWFDLQVYFAGSTDGGATWSAQRRIDHNTLPSGGSHTPQVAVVGSVVHVVWEDTRLGGADLFYSASRDGGATWPPVDTRVTVRAKPGFSFPQLQHRIAAAGDAVYAVWKDDVDGAGDIFFSRSLDAGLTWSAMPVRLDTGTAPGGSASRQPRIAAVEDAIYVVWEDDRTGASRIWFNRSLDQGGTWLPHPVRIDRAVEGRAVAPKLAAEGASVYVVWQDDRAGGSDVYFNRSWNRGLLWRDSDVRLNTGSAPGATPVTVPVVAAAAGAVPVAWLDARSGRAQVYANIPFGVQTYGVGLTGTGGVAPSLSGDGEAVIGATVSVDLTRGLGGTVGALLVGGPASATALPVLGGTLLVAPALTVPVQLDGVPGAPGAGSASLPLPLPTIGAVVGLDLSFQGWLLDAAAAAGVAMSNGMALWIG
ncbi:MAG: sialidase family protein [Planctomycetota bacterium]